MTDIAAQPFTPTLGSEVPAALCLIDGAWVEGQGPMKDTVNPATGEVVTRVAYASAEQVDAAVAAAKKAQKEWAKVPMAARADIIVAAADAMEARAAEIGWWVSREMGKTLAEARDEILEITVPVTRATAAEARGFAGSTPPASSAAYPRRRVQTIFQPIGVTSFISPWNFPVEMIGNAAVALLTGNATVWKPSEWAPYAPQLITEAFLSVGVPEGLVNLVYGGPEIGEHLVANPDVGLVAFIGSTAVGEQIARAAGVKRLLLELGGNGPQIVLDDADLDKAVEAATLGCFYQAGQVCTSAERILVHEDVHDEFVAKMTAAAKAIKIGDPQADGTDMGPLSDKRILDKVVAHVEDARANGATVTTGGHHEGLFYAPTVLSGVTPDMVIAREETFGPVAPIIKISSAEEALTIANDSPYGLSMSVFTSDLATAFDMAEGLEAGAVNVNSSTNDWELNGPFGGWKKSGIGRELGVFCMREFSNVKTITFDLG
ncbi:aldehyde dehydrogenase family protein [Nocardioides sp. AN3]